METKQITPVKKGDSLSILGHRWKDLVNVNEKTYYSCVALINGRPDVVISFSEGENFSFLKDMLQLLHEKEYLPVGIKSQNSIEDYCASNQITLYIKCVNVHRKKDL